MVQSLKPKGRFLSQFLQALPNFRGKKKLAKFLFSDVFKMQNGSVVDRAGTVFHVPSLEEPLAQHIFIDGIYEPDTCKVIERVLKYGDTFFDVGANIGFFSAVAAKIVGVDGSVYAFEASPGIAVLLNENIQLNQFKNIRIINAAVSHVTAQKLSFYESPNEKFGMGSLSPQFEKGPISIESVTLDGLVRQKNITKVALIKVDVEGHEASVFKGARELFEQQSPVIVFEFCDWAEKRAGFALGESQRILMECGYKLWRAEAFLKKQKPITAPLTTGFEMIVAKR